MIRHHSIAKGLSALLTAALLFGTAWAATTPAPRRAATLTPSRMQKRWLFGWRPMHDPTEVDRMIARFPRAQADGYNGVAFSYNIAPEKAPALKQAAKQYGLDLI